MTKYVNKIIFKKSDYIMYTVFTRENWIETITQCEVLSIMMNK